jgi:hypothetical protein
MQLGRARVKGICLIFYTCGLFFFGIRKKTSNVPFLRQNKNYIVKNCTTACGAKGKGRRIEVRLFFLDNSTFRSYVWFDVHWIEWMNKEKSKSNANFFLISFSKRLRWVSIGTQMYLRPWELSSAFCRDEKEKIFQIDYIRGFCISRKQFFFSISRVTTQNQ